MNTIYQTYSDHRKVFEPVAIVASALLLGRTRFIRYFPNATPSGLLTASAIFGATSHALSRSGEPYPLYVKAAALSFAVAAATLLAEKTARMGTLRFAAIPVILTAIPHRSTYSHYRNNPILWWNLDDKTRTTLAREFMDSGKLAFGDGKLVYGAELFEESKRDEEAIQSMTRAELSWFFRLLGPKDPKGKFVGFQTCIKHRLYPPFYDLTRDDKTFLNDKVRKKTLANFCDNHREYLYNFLTRTAGQKAKNKDHLQVNPMLPSDELLSMPIEVVTNWGMAIEDQGDWEKVPQLTRELYVQQMFCYEPEAIPTDAYREPFDWSWRAQIPEGKLSEAQRAFLKRALDTK